MRNRVPFTLALLAALALALAPVRELLYGTVDWLGFARAALAMLAAWGLARQFPWARWLLTAVAAVTLWAVWRASAAGLAGGVPAYPIWRVAQVLGVALLVAAAVMAWEARLRPERAAGRAG